MYRKQPLLFVVLVVLNSCLSSPALAQPALDSLVRTRYVDWLLAMEPKDPLHGITMPGADGRWADINYSDEQVGKWNPAEHLRRTKMIALAWARPGTRSYHDESLLRKITAALVDWLQHRYKSRNWWHNEIGVPQYMRDILFLSGNALEKKVYEGSLTIFHQLKVNGTGANLVWSADLGLHYGLLTGDTVLVKFCADTLQAAVRVRTDEGVQPDYSFHQHGPRLQQYQYGRAFLLDNLRLAFELRGTPFAYSSEKVEVLTDFALEGWQWMARGIHTVPGTMDRSASRANALQSAALRSVIPFFIQLNPAAANRLRLLDRVQAGDTTLRGYRYFPRSDFTAMQQPRFSFFLKTNSTRTLLTESINGENLSGDMLDNGDSYFIGDGQEYYNLMPVWNWQFLPGITSFRGAVRKEIQQKAFTGNVSDGKNGLAVMEQELGKEGAAFLRVRKAWISHQNSTIVLMGGMQTSGLLQPAFTVMDQCRSRGGIQCSESSFNELDSVQSFQRLRWVYHHGFVYLPLYDDSVVIDHRQRTGRWTDINRSESPDLVKDSVFLPFIVHRAGDSASGYAVVSCENAVAAKKMTTKPAWKILSNTSRCQSVCFVDGCAAIAVYQPGAYILKEIGLIKVDKSCLLWRDESKHWYASDPSHQGGELHLEIGKLSWSVHLPNDGATIALKK